MWSNFPSMLSHNLCPAGWGCRIHRLFFRRRVRPPHANECLGYDLKQLDGEIPVMLEFWGMRSIHSLPSLPGSLWLEAVAPDRVLSMDQIELNCVFMLNWIVWNRTVLCAKLNYLKLNCFWHWNSTYTKVNCLK